MTDPRQELQTLAASALMVGLHQAIEAYHEVVRGAKAAEHSRVSANAPAADAGGEQRARRGHLVRSVPDPPARSRREASAPMPSDQPDVAEASHRRSVGRQRDHCTPTPPGRWRSQRARHPASPLPAPSSPPGSYTQEHRGPTAVSSDVTVPVGSKSLTRQLAPIHRRRVRAWFAHACQHAALPTAKPQPECAVLPDRTWQPTTPLSQDATPCVADLRVVADGLSRSKAQSQPRGGVSPPAPVDMAPYRRDELEDMRARHRPRP